MPITTKVETITPDLAKKYLEKSRGNRTIRESRVAQHMENIKAGKWLLNNDAICFDEHDVLMNGHHRLTAIALADKPVQVTVTRGLSPKAIDIIDVGAPRNASDMLQFKLGQDTKYYREKTSLARGVLDAFSDNKRSSRDEVVAYAVKHNDLLEKFCYLQKYAPTGVAAAFCKAVITAKAPLDYVLDLSNAYTEQRFSDATEPLRLLSKKLAKMNDPRKRYMEQRYRLTVNALRAIFHNKTLVSLVETSKDWEFNEVEKSGRKQVLNKRAEEARAAADVISVQ